MPHSHVHLEDDSEDSLQGTLADLSLTDTQKANANGNKSSQFNPFQAFISQGAARDKASGAGFNPFTPYLFNNSVDYGLVRTIDNLMQNVIPQHLTELQNPRWFTLDESHALYIQGLQFQEKWSVSEEGFLNWMKLLSGWADFPALMLLNPSPRDHLPFEEMVDESTTLSWIRETLEEMNLDLDKVIVFDMFPMLRESLREDILRREGPKKLAELTRESFALTKASLELIRPQFLISCQCCTKPMDDRWGFFDDKVALQLCSSIAGAQSRKVRRVEVGNHQMHVVLGMHPQYVVQRNTDMEKVLAKVFAEVFEPFGAWQSRRTAWEESLQAAGALLLGTAGLLRRQMQLYRKLCEQASASGVYGSVTERRMRELEEWLMNWEK